MKTWHIIVIILVILITAGLIIFFIGKKKKAAAAAAKATLPASGKANVSSASASPAGSAGGAAVNNIRPAACDNTQIVIGAKSDLQFKFNDWLNKKIIEKAIKAMPSKSALIPDISAQKKPLDSTALQGLNAGQNELMILVSALGAQIIGSSKNMYTAIIHKALLNYNGYTAISECVMIDLINT